MHYRQTWQSECAQPFLDQARICSPPPSLTIHTIMARRHNPLQSFTINNYITVEGGAEAAPPSVAVDGGEEAELPVVAVEGDEEAEPEELYPPAEHHPAVPIPPGAPPPDGAQLTAIMEATRTAAREAVQARSDAALLLTECERQVALGAQHVLKAGGIRQSVVGYSGSIAKAASSAANSATESAKSATDAAKSATDAAKASKSAGVANSAALDHAQRSANSATTSTIAMRDCAAASKTCSEVQLALGKPAFPAVAPFAPLPAAVAMATLALAVPPKLPSVIRVIDGAPVVNPKTPPLHASQADDAPPARYSSDEADSDSDGSRSKRRRT